MPDRHPTVLFDDLWFPEGPRWHDGRLWFSDMHAHQVFAATEAGERETVAHLDGRPSGLGWLPDGRLLVVSMEERELLRLESSSLVEHADLSALASWHCNDMVVDGEGRAYVGNFGSAMGDVPANLVLVTPDGAARVVAEDLMFPNGTVITPDGRTLIVAETWGLRLTAFDVEGDGSLTNRRLWAQLDVPPDGICLDAEGCIWVAAITFEPDGMGAEVELAPGGFVRVAEGGEVRERIASEDTPGFACTLGGESGRVLFMLESFEHDVTKMRGPGNGRIRAVEVDVPRAGWP